ncbi:hypothetical protein KR032_009192, partial [Drosophila birchii]
PVELVQAVLSNMNSGIQEFFNNKTVFLTGGSGYLGKVIIEKLLRTTEVKRIYTLIRPKRGVSIDERITAWEKDPIFEVLLKAKPEALHRICPVVGDCLSPDLDISDADRELLVSEVQVVIHGAATVRFDEPLHVASAINVRATRLMLQLAKQMTQLVSFVHVSTAYSNCVATEIDERFYPENLSCSSDKVLAIANILGNETLDNLTSFLIGSFPNTYTYTKALAEDVIRREAGNLPLCIFRPAIVMSTYKEPIGGWSDNLYGPMALAYGGARGVVRVVMSDPNVRLSVVPAEYCSNLALTCAWKTGVNPGRGCKPESPPIYQFAPSENNEITQKSFIDLLVMNRDFTPLNQMIWYPYVLMIPPFLFPLAAFFYHIIPGYFLDTLLRLSGRKPILVKTYRKIHKNIKVLRLFSNTTFNFGMENTEKLLAALSKKDRSMFNFDMVPLDWTDYLRCCIGGMRLYIAKEPATQESVSKALRLKNILKVLHIALSLSLATGAGYVFWSLAKLFV